MVKDLKNMFYKFIDWGNWCLHYKSLKEDYENMKLEIDMNRLYYEKKLEEKRAIIEYLESKKKRKVTKK